MASQRGLVRSFYGWLVRTERALRERADSPVVQILPATRPTALRPVIRVSLLAVRALRGTEYEKKATYWADVFQRILVEGWHGEKTAQDVARDKIQERLKAVSDGGVAL